MSAARDACRFNPGATLELKRVGAEKTPLLVIDDLAADPDALVDIAARANWVEPSSTYYPGLNAPAPPAYLEEIQNTLRPSLERAFGLARDRDIDANAFFALATWEPARFGPWQRIPHYDHARVGPLAMVHYLGKEAYGGTGFFRHDATGFEFVDADRRERYLSTVTTWLEGAALPTYAGPETPGFRLLESVSFRFNRALIYPSCILHCALFDDTPFSDDPRTGRLTANTFLHPD